MEVFPSQGRNRRLLQEALECIVLTEPEMVSKGMRFNVRDLFIPLLTLFFFVIPNVDGGVASNTVRELYPGHNDIRANRLNLLFVGAEYPSFEVFREICSRLIALQGESRQGLMTLRPFSEPGFAERFNFWISEEIAVSGQSPASFTNGLMWETVMGACNRAISRLNLEHGTALKLLERNMMYVLLVNADPRERPDYGYNGGSFGRAGTFTVWHENHPWFSPEDMIVTHVHELAHSIAEMDDEYGGKGHICDLPNWQTRDYKKQFFVPGSEQDPGKTTREEFESWPPGKRLSYVRRHAPWEDMLGQGEGDLQVDAFEGGLGFNRGIFRAVKNSLMNYPYGLQPGSSLGFGPHLERLIRERLSTEFP